MRNRHLFFGFVFASCSVGCTRTSQWVVVTDCQDKRPILGASVYAVQGRPDAWKSEIEVYNHAEAAKGGKTDADGATWARFPKLVDTSVRATTGDGSSEKSGHPNPWTVVPPGAPEQISVCIDRKNR